MEYINNVSFTSPTGKTVNFDEHGGVKAKYKIYNYQVVFSCQNCSKSFNIVNVGYWGGNVPQHHLKFGLTKLGDIMYQLKSQCQICRVDFTKRKVMFSCLVPVTLVLDKTTLTLHLQRNVKYVLNTCG